MQRPAALACSALLAGAFAACGSAGPAKPAVKPNLILVTIDTTRADHLGCYGDARAETPVIDRLAREGVVLDQVIATVPMTLPSHVSILTGLYPPRHGVRDNADFHLPDSETTLAEHLRAHGYATAASVGARVLASTLGLNQGFDTYDEPHGNVSHAGGENVRFVPLAQRRADTVTDDALGAIARSAGGPFFLWVHYFDPHAEYDPPEPFHTRFADRLYDGEIAYVDQQIGRLVAEVDHRGLGERTLIVITSDHGESLGEHGESTHGLFVYDATLRVPLIARGPSLLPAGRRYDGLVSLVDLVPTVLDLMGLPPLGGVQGVSHAAALRGGPPVERGEVYAESLYAERTYGWAPLLAWRSASRKFIDAPEPEIYDLAADPHETRNMASDRPDAVRDQRRILFSALQGFGVPDSDASTAMTADQKAVLESLGYVVSGGASKRVHPPDPKRLIAVHAAFSDVRAAVAKGDYARAARLLDDLLAKDPGNPAAQALRGTVAFATGGRAEGIESLQRAATDAPTVYENQWNLANALHAAGRYPEAVKAYRAAIAIAPRDGAAHQALGNALLATKDYAGAVAAYRSARELGVSTTKLYASLGAALMGTGDLDRAERALRGAVEGDPKNADAWNKLGIVQERRGRRDEALVSFSHALDADLTSADALFNRGKLLLILKRPDEAARDIDALTARHPEAPGGWFLAGNLAASRRDFPAARAALERCLAARSVDPAMAVRARELLAKLPPGR